MVPDQGMPAGGPPPELLAAIAGQAGGGLDGPPEEAPAGPAPEELSAADHLKEAIVHLKIALADPEDDDDMDNAALSKAIADLSKLIGGRDDAAMSAMGGNPKQLRAMGRAGGVPK